MHRDVKPANVLLGEDDHAYLTDFGLTKQLTLSADGGLSRTGAWVGTLGYAAPEQIRGERVDARTDVYALGCVLVHALTGSPPYVRDSDHATMWAHLNASPPTEGRPAGVRRACQARAGQGPGGPLPLGRRPRPRGARRRRQQPDPRSRADRRTRERGAVRRKRDGSHTQP